MKIEIISGSYGWRKTKDAMPKLVERGGICEVDEAEARRLVALGVAAIVHEADEAPVASGSTVESGDTPCADMPSEENGAESGAEAHLDAEQLQEMTLRTAACSFSMAAAIRPTRTRASARASFTSPNGGPGAAAPGAFPPAPAGGMSASPKAEWGTGRSPVDTIFENNVFCYFLPFFRMRGRPEV